MADIPPWLDVTPGQTVAALETGVSQGDQMYRFDQSGKQQAIAQAQAVAAENAKLQQTQQLAAIDAHVTQQKNQQDFLRSMAQTSALDAYRQTQLQQQQQKNQVAAADAAQKFALAQAKEQDINTDKTRQLSSTDANRLAVLGQGETKTKLEAVRASANAAAVKVSQLQTQFGPSPSPDQKKILDAANADFDAKKNALSDLTQQLTVAGTPPPAGPAIVPTTNQGNQNMNPNQVGSTMPGGGVFTGGGTVGGIAPPPGLPQGVTRPGGQNVPYGTSPVPTQKGAVVKQGDTTYQYDGQNWNAIDDRDF